MRALQALTVLAVAAPVLGEPRRYDPTWASNGVLSWGRRGTTPGD